jgi:hypothetical protein
MKLFIHLHYDVHYENQHCLKNLNQMIYTRMYLTYMEEACTLWKEIGDFQTHLHIII